MFARLEHLGNYEAFIFNNTRQKPYSSPENPDILVNELTVYYLGRRSHLGHVSHGMCLMSHVTCPMSLGTCHMSHGTLF